MVKTAKDQIEKDEQIIIRELQKNAKESIDTIAKNCGFSRQKVWRVIKRLEQNMTIWGYHAVVDNERLHQKQYYLLMKRSNKPVTKQDDTSLIERRLKKESEKLGVTLLSSMYVHGTFDWLFKIVARDIKDVKRFKELFYRLFKDLITDVQILEVVFPIEDEGFTNPNISEFPKLF